MEQDTDTVDYAQIDSSEHSQTSSDSIKSSYCAICLETEEVNTRYIKFPCQHVFHIHCFETYVDYNIEHKPSKANIECPVCRQLFSTNTLRTVFSISHESPNENITILIPSTDNTVPTEVNTTRARGCTQADIFVIILLFLGLTLYLLALYKRI